jgi:hypothetical protein
MKLAQITGENFQRALDKLYSQQLPIKTAFKLKGIIKVIREEYAKYEEVRNNALKKYGKKDDKGELVVDSKNKVQFENDSYEEFLKEFNELTSLDINIDQIKLSELGDASLSTQDLEILNGLIVED